jgi:acetyl-CoA acetyltransferase
VLAREAAKGLRSLPIDVLATVQTRGSARIAGHADLCSFEATVSAARRAYAVAGIGPADVDVVELHDCFAQNELITYEALGLCPEGGAERFVDSGDNTYGGKVVTNPSGGLLSKGHPLGATGVAQCHELVTQLRGAAGLRQVEGARLALQHNVGLGGACVVTIYEAG